METTARPVPKPGPSPAHGEALARVSDAARRLDALAPGGGTNEVDVRTLGAHVAAFDAVHRALQDALAPTEG